ncbi:MAG: hypothetical protein LBF34_03625 [Puniceicoccales bacterium]|jgi:hypothetical protein|nr:hypothetical protein [Puniceicoccales bacterium]
MNKMKHIYFLLLWAMFLEQGAYGTIDIDNYDWNAEQKIWYEKDGTRKIEKWKKIIKDTQDKITTSDDKAQCSRKCIAETYIDLFFPEITKGSQYISKVAEIEQILVNKRNTQADLRTFTAGCYGNENFFKQTAIPLRQLITNVLKVALERDKLDLSNNAAVQAFWEKIVIFLATARNAVAMVAGSNNMQYFGIPMDEGFLVESFHNIFSPAQVRLVHWLASKDYTTLPEDWEMLQPKNYTTVLETQVTDRGHIFHSKQNMLFIGNCIFKECMEEANHLKKNPSNPEALAAFTQAMKKFMYIWSQSSTCHRGQAAILAMLADSIVKYAGFQLKRPEIPEEVRIALAQLTERFPESGKVEGSETETGYTVWARGVNFPRKKNEKWLQDLYYHCDVFALLMPSFEAFDERYKCEFVPIQTDETPPETT